MESRDVREDLLRRLIEVKGVQAALTSTADGLLIEGRGSQTDLEAAAAVGTSILQAAQRISRLDGRRPPQIITTEADGEMVVVRRIGEDEILVILTDSPGNVAYVRFLVGRYPSEQGVGPPRHPS